MSEWLGRTGQEWKLRLGMVWILASIALFVAVIVGGALSIAWLLAALPLSAAGLCWTAFAIRCPACRKRVVFWAMVHEPGHEWLLRTTRLDRCPICGDSAAPRT